MTHEEMFIELTTNPREGDRFKYCDEQRKVGKDGKVFDEYSVCGRVQEYQRNADKVTDIRLVARDAMHPHGTNAKLRARVAELEKRLHDEVLLNEKLRFLAPPTTGADGNTSDSAAHAARPVRGQEERLHSAPSAPVAAEEVVRVWEFADGDFNVERVGDTDTTPMVFCTDGQWKENGALLQTIKSSSSACLVTRSARLAAIRASYKQWKAAQRTPGTAHYRMVTRYMLVCDAATPPVSADPSMKWVPVGEGK